MDRFGNGWLVRGKTMEAFRGVFGSVRWILLGSPHSLVGGNPEGHWTAAISKGNALPRSFHRPRCPRLCLTNQPIHLTNHTVFFNLLPSRILAVS